MKISNSVIIHTSFRFKQNDLRLSLSSVLCIVTRVNCIVFIRDPRTKRFRSRSNMNLFENLLDSWIPFLILFAVFIHFIIYSYRLAYWYDIRNHIIKIVNSVLNSHQKLILTSYPFLSYQFEIISPHKVRCFCKIKIQISGRKRCLFFVDAHNLHTVCNIPK